jgi:hypothetical protein
VGDRSVVDVDGVVLAEIPEGRASDGCAQVGNDPVGQPKRCVMSSMNFVMWTPHELHKTNNQMHKLLYFKDLLQIAILRNSNKR